MKKKYILLIIFCVILTACLKKDSYKNTDFSLASQDEKILLKNFYRNEQVISKGKIFDFKYVNYDDRSPSFFELEMIKKVDDNIILDEFLIYDQNNNLIMKMGDNEKLPAYYDFEDNGNIYNAMYIFPEHHYFASVSGDRIFSPYKNYKDKEKYSELAKKIKSIKIVLKFDGNTETHKLKYNEECALLELKEDVETDVTNFSDGLKSYFKIKKANYSFYLIREDFLQWEAVIKKALKDKSDERFVTYSWDAMFGLPYFNDKNYSRKYLRKFLELNDDTYNRYMILLNEALKKNKLDYPFND